MAYHRNRRSPDLPLSSFDPRYKELLIRGARAEFTLDCATLQEARALRARIHTYRARAKHHHGDSEVGRAEWEPLYLCSIYLVSGPPIRLRFAPRHAEFDSVLSQAGMIAEPVAPKETIDLLEQLEREQAAHDAPKEGS